VPLVLGFALLMGTVLLLTSGITGTSFADVIKGESGKLYKEHEEALAKGKSAPTAIAAGATGATAAGSGTGAAALTHAISQLGVPYKWGGEIEKVAFDCSGLVQWAFAKAGASLPRTAQEQYAATKRITSAAATAGDLVFFGSSPSDISHVGILSGPGQMIDAPHTGASVGYETFPAAIGSLWGSDKVIGYGEVG
jgi:cell wall-associated NlpC family hydrolase